MKIHHIGYAVKNIEKARKSFKKLGFSEKGEMTFDRERNVKILFMENEVYRIELVAPADRERQSPVDHYLKRQGGGHSLIIYAMKQPALKWKRKICKKKSMC